MAGRTRNKTKIIHKHPRKGPSWFALLLAHSAKALGAMNRQAKKEFPALAKQGPMFAPKRAGAGAKVGASRGGGGPMGAEPKGFRPAWEDRDGWGRDDLYWRGDEDDWRDDGRSADERAQDLRDAGYDGDIDADGYAADDADSWADVPQADWGNDAVGGEATGSDAAGGGEAA